MTLEEIEAIPRQILTAADVAPFLECDPNVIRGQAQRDPVALGFPVVVMGSRVKIPKAAFVYAMRYGRPICPNIPEAPKGFTISDGKLI